MKVENLLVKREELEQFKMILEDWIPKDASIAIAIAGNYVFYSPSTAHFHLKIGESVHPQSIAARVLSTRKKTEILSDDSLFGTPYYAVGYPISVNQEEAALIIVLPSTYSSEIQESYKFLTGRQEDDWTPIPIEQISHIESLQKRTWFYCNEEKFKTPITLKELQTKLPSCFLRIHRSYIINIYFIKRIAKDLTSNYIIELKNGVELPVSQSYLGDLRSVLEF
ncbi:LytTR family transcriptional regulator [Lysinibacillus yapensis]|uniref:LytTR family transcriptional regulator n=1 Tax=Ureibacillus yapensis TaxID=2304605 RepID=A0A396S4R1_9BACL|nr:LytTR family DNA-binding domain-containing protein [Lysinibacillus yapensis]RHW32792.1 LytTR family transcriptional regulator [Lysinibacillus yapensis]